MANEREALIAVSDQAKAFAADHAVELAREINQWHETSLLPETCKMRDLAAIVAPLGHQNSLALAENFANSAIRAALAAPAPSAAPAEPLAVFSTGPWIYAETGEGFSGRDLDIAAFVVYRNALAASPPAPAQQAEPTDAALDAAARKLAECMDYPWDSMPQESRRRMREHAKAIIGAARATTGDHHGE